jgi:RNA polymerase sigma-70 factor (ECF subfamily)
VGPNDKTTEDLIREIKQGLNVEENFRLLFERYYGQIHRFFHRKGFSSEDCRELTQETFLSVYKGLEGFRQESTFGHWMYSIAKNIWRSELDHRRAKGRDAPLISLDQEGAYGEDELSSLKDRIADPVPDQLYCTIEKQKSQKLHDALLRLSEKKRRYIELRILHNLSYREIAELTNTPINTVKAHLHQAKKELSETLKSDFGEVEL